MECGSKAMKNSKKNVKKTRSLDTQVEHMSDSAIDSEFLQPEDFIRPLAEEIQKEVQAPKIDLRTQASARESLVEIAAVSKKLEQYRNRIDKLRPLLEQRRFELENQEDS